MKAFFTKQSSSLTYLNVTQFLGALNDNIFKFLIVYFLIHLEGQEHSETILAMAGAIFVLPFLLFSAGSGTLADRFSKRNIIVSAKALEMIVMSLGILALALESKIGAYTILFLMATQSAFFGPSKYGIVPEIVEEEKISKANGLLTSFTYFAIIVGTFLASFVTEITNRNFVLVATMCAAISLAGLLTSFCIERTPPSGSRKRIHPFFLREIYRSLKIARGENTLLIAVVGSAFFLFCGAYVQLNMIPYAINQLGMNEIKGGYLFLLTALGIGIGSITAGKISGKYVELGLVPLGGLGMSICAFLLDYFSDSLVAVVFLLVLTGMAGGLYVLPLDAFIQVASPNQHRGQVVAASNFLAFVGVLAASGMLYFVSKVIGLAADKGFSIVGWMALIVATYMAFHLRDYMIRFLGMLVSRICFELSITGRESVPPGTSTVLLCPYRSGSDTLMMLGAQRQRIHFFFERKKHSSLGLKLLRQFLKVSTTGTLEPTQLNDKTRRRIRKALDKGRSVCVFYDAVRYTDANDADDADNTADSSFVNGYRELLSDTEHMVIPVDIEKNPKIYPDNGFIYRILRVIRVPASITF